MGMQWLSPTLSVASFFLFAPAISAQSDPDLSCFASTGSPAMVRAEGVAELVSDYFLTCRGGEVGISAMLNFTLDLNAPLTSRLVAPSKSLGEPLLIVDDLNGGASPASNIYQGTVNGNSVVFGAQFTAPGPSGIRTLRITNVRVDASALPRRPGRNRPASWGA